MALSPEISRRQMLGHVARAAAAGIALPHLALFGAGDAPSPNDQIGVGIIGCGRRNGQLVIGKGGQVHCPRCADRGGADLNLKRAEQWAKNYRCQAYQDYRALLDRNDVDVVLYATPEHWHYLPCIHACQAGKDIYGEQP